MAASAEVDFYNVLGTEHLNPDLIADARPLQRNIERNVLYKFQGILGHHRFTLLISTPD